MTTDPRAEAERWLKKQFQQAWMTYKRFPSDELAINECARIAADFAEKMVAARDKEWVDVVRKTRPNLPPKVTIISPLPWTEAMQEGGK